MPAPLVDHDPRYRRLWMVPRNKRYIPAWKLAQLVHIFSEIAGGNEWRGNPKLQEQFRRTIEGLGLKRSGQQRNDNPGGDRTYAKQLECLGLVFQRRDGTFASTLAGQALKDGSPPLRILQTQLLRHQYPSSYGASRNVLIHPALRVKPFLFLLQLLRHPGIGHLSDDEIAIAVIYGHNHQCLQLCVRKIEALRSGKTLEAVVDSPRTDLYTSRTKEADLAKRFEDVKNIGNTFSNYLSASNLAVPQRIQSRKCLVPNPAFSSIVDEALLSIEDFIVSPKNHESYQRAYGRLDAEKDSRLTPTEGVPAPDPELGLISAQLRSYCEVHPAGDFSDDFLSRLISEYGFSREKVMRAAESMRPRAKNIFEETFLELSQCGGDTAAAVQFEKAVCAIFSEQLHFTAWHTGQKRRPLGRGGYADVLVKALAGEIYGLLDAKSIARYALPASDYRAMVNDYIPSYQELIPKEPSTKVSDLKGSFLGKQSGDFPQLEFACYVAAGFSSGIAEHLKEIESETSVPCASISAKRLLRIAAEFGSPEKQESLRALLRKGQPLD